MQWQHQQGLAKGLVNIDMPAQQKLGLYRLRARLTVGDKVQEVERSLRVHPPVDYAITQQQVGNTLQYKVAVTPLLKQLDLDASQVTLTGQRSDATGLQKSILLDVDKWQASWRETEALSALSLRLDGVTLAGELVIYQVPAMQVNVLTPKQVAQQQQAQSVDVADLPEASVIEVQEDTSNDTSSSAAVSQEKATDEMQALMQEPADNEQPLVTVEAEPAAEEVDNRVALFGILLFIFLAILVWMRMKGRSQNTDK